TADTTGTAVDGQQQQKAADGGRQTRREGRNIKNTETDGLQMVEKRHVVQAGLAFKQRQGEIPLADHFQCGVDGCGFATGKKAVKVKPEKAQQRQDNQQQG